MAASRILKNNIIVLLVSLQSGIVEVSRTVVSRTVERIVCEGWERNDYKLKSAAEFHNRNIFRPKVYQSPCL